MKSWVPYKLINTDGRQQCSWLNTFGKQFTEPFFEETILKCLGLNSHYTGIKSVSNLTMIEEWATNLDAVDPFAFIFHISRCGSTLVSQLLATSGENIVLSEVPFFDDILRLPFKDNGFNEAATSALLAASLKYYGQKRTRQEKRLFIKTDSWHLFFYQQLRQLYPSVPFILMYRSPDEVFRSHLKMPGIQAVPGLIEPQLFGLKPHEIIYDREIYLVKVLECYLSKCLEIAAIDQRCLLVNYNEGPIPIIQKIADFTNTRLTGQELSEMTERCRYHSKKPGESFHEEINTNIPAALNKAMKLYDLLDEQKRLK